MGKYWRRDIKVVRNCWGRCEEVLGGVEKCVGTPHFSTPPPLFSTRPHTPTHFPAPSTLTPYTFPHLSHTYPPPNALTHFFHIAPYLTQLPKLKKNSQFSHHPYSPKFSTLPRFFPILPSYLLYHLPRIKISHFYHLLPN